MDSEQKTDNYGAGLYQLWKVRACWGLGGAREFRIAEMVRLDPNLS